MQSHFLRGAPGQFHRQFFVPAGTSRAERIGVSLNLLAQAFGQARGGKQIITERKRLIEIAGLRPPASRR